MTSCLLVVGLLVAAQPAAARKLCHRKTNFCVKAPKGFKLKVKKGIYVISKGTARVAYMRLDSDTSAASAGASLVEQEGATLLSKKESANRYTAQVDRKGRRDTIDVRDKGKVLEVRTYGVGAASSGKASAAAVPLATLQRIANAARGGRALPLPVGKVQVPVAPVAMEPYTAPDGLASAQVPSGGDCWRSGAKGAIEGYCAGGEYVLGVGMIIFAPGMSAIYPGVIESDYLNPADALVQLYPRTRAFAPGTPVTGMTIEQTMPANLPGYQSALYIASFTHNNAAWKGAFLVGTTPNLGGAPGWLMYVSTISVPQSDDTSWSQALVETWKSWDPGAAVEQRIRDTNTTIRATTEDIQSVNEFRQRVYDKTNNNWDRYIRGQEPILEPVRG